MKRSSRIESIDGRSLGSFVCVSPQIKDTDLVMARKAGQGEEEEVAQSQEAEREKTPVCHEEKKPACHGGGHHVVEQDKFIKVHNISTTTFVCLMDIVILMTHWVDVVHEPDLGMIFKIIPETLYS
ncbi:hypothetical protein STEG23_010745, partial [Scotinomys teguina]